MKPQPDAVYLFFCHLEWRARRNSDAHKELFTALNHEDIEMRQVAESLLHSNAETAGKLDINVIESEDGSLVCLSGPIDIDSSPALRDQLLSLLESRRSKVVSVDFSAVTHIDSSAVATLIEALKIAHACKTGLKLQGLHDALLRVFQFMGILSLFNGSSQTVVQSHCEVV
ncbi:MAG TPA: STAS domain-containing protein [Candidatus Angelobacter sp.]